MRENESNKKAEHVYHTTIKHWPEGERPRERLYTQGPSALTDAELLAILIRTGTKGTTAVDLARILLAKAGSLKKLGAMSARDLAALKIGRARAASLVAAFELSRRIPFKDHEPQPTIRTPGDVANLYLPKFRDLRHEEFWVLHLNSANQLVRSVRVTTGTLNTSLVHPRECFRDALKETAASVIFLHNHPSGNPEPSQEDIAVTKQLVESGKILGIPVHDHVIVAGGTYVSFAERGLL
ncbi:MAG TPA: DNA repair protein RadC [Bacteroidota bacterium]|nr:DNA repair protein RadC [Bacteroidota bacterium]